jgi:dihydroflavonol-4-reductase
MKALVTGANGHIGCHVVRAARDAGMEAVAFVREGSDRRGLAGVDVEVRTGDLFDAGSIGRAMEGIDVVFHVAAVHRNFAANPDDIVRPAVEGTQNVLDAARAKGVRRVVYTSSAATVGFTTDPARPLTEDDFLETAESPYTRGKIEAEKVARAASDLDVRIMNPSGVFGPRDYRLTPASRAIVGVLQGDPIFLHLSATDVRDVATAHVLAATKGQKGRRYIATGDVLAPKDTVALYMKLAGVKPPTFSPPRFLANLLAGRMEKKALASGGDAGLTRAIVKDNIGRHLVYDSTRARTELGATFRPAEQVLRDTFRWLLFIGALAPKTAAKVTRTLGEAAAPDPDWTK